MSWYLTETQLTHLSFRLRNLLLFTTVSMFSCCSKGGRAIADRDFFLLENQITTPKPFHAKILNYWDFLRRRKPPFSLSLNTSSQASSPKVSDMHWNSDIRYFRANLEITIIVILVSRSCWSQLNAHLPLSSAILNVVRQWNRVLLFI